MKLLAIPNQNKSIENVKLAKQVIDALKPEVIVTDGIFSWTHAMAIASLEFNVKLHVAQPWKKDLEPEIYKKASSVSVFSSSPPNFFMNSTEYINWLRENVTHGSMLANESSRMTKFIVNNLENLHVFEHEG